MANTGLMYGDARAIAARIVAIIEGQTAEPAVAWPWMALDAVMLGTAATVIAMAAVAVRRSRTWTTRRVGYVARAVSLALLLSPLALWLGMHRVVGFLYRGRDVAWIQVPYLFPSFMILLAVVSVCGIVVFGARLVAWRAAARTASTGRP
jgi:hypothetical protein